MLASPQSQMPSNIPTSIGTSPFPDGTYPVPKRLVITQQTCLVEEKFSKNGIQKNVHVVVKNNPFLLTLALLDKGLNFHQLSTEVQLVYDCPSLKEVDFVKLKPLEWKTRPNDEGDQLTVELRIKVLTSQLEDMFFRVKVKIVDPRTRKEYPHLSALTHPIRVVSKPDQVRKKVKKRKRAPTDSLMDTMHRLESHQREQQQMLKRLCMFTVNDANTLNPSAPVIKEEDADASVPSTFGSDSNDGHNSSTTTPSDTPATVTNNASTKDEFRHAFLDFLGAFKQLQNQDPQDGYKINTCANDAHTMAEVLDLVRSELKKMQSPSGFKQSETSHDSPCACRVCPYKERMDKINDSYKEYLYSAVLPDLSSHADSTSLAPAPPSSSTNTITPPPMALVHDTSSTCASSVSSSGLLLDLYSDADALLAADGDAALAAFLNLGGGNGFGFGGFGDLYNFTSLEPIA